jgi:Na+-transporting NADH:ubiquinone oxidoreductase subunit F
VYYFGANEPGELCLVDLMKEFEKELADFRFVPAVYDLKDSDGEDFEKGLVTDVVKRDLKNAGQFEAYLCGSPGMIDATVVVLKELGMVDENIFYDKFE